MSSFSHLLPHNVEIRFGILPGSQKVRSLPNLRQGLQTFSGGHCRSFLISWQTLLIWVALSARRRCRRYSVLVDLWQIEHDLSSMYCRQFNTKEAVFHRIFTSTTRPPSTDTLMHVWRLKETSLRCCRREVKTFIQVALNLCKYILTLKLSGSRTSTLYLLLSYKISAINAKCDILFYE